jgi:aspartate/methionine/tyrosine aminotransferase
VAALGSINLCHFLPDYTAYEELLSIFRLFAPIAILLDRERGYRFDAADLRREVVGLGLGAVLRSNPCNPTGEHLRGDDLAEWVAVSRQTDCTLLMDEFYSHYAWAVGGASEQARAGLAGGARGDDASQEPALGEVGERLRRAHHTDEAEAPVSAARYVEDVDKDPVVIVDGLTKNWRYPGWRVSWTVAPKKIIEAVTSAGSFLDGGAAAPMQYATIPLLEPDRVRQEIGAIRRAFLHKRQRVLEAAREMGLVIDAPPEGTFYAWASLEKLPPPFDDGMTFFRRALEWRVICVPGEFFDVNPGKRRPGNRGKRFSQFVRLSFGPNIDEVELALKRLRAMIPSL